MMIFLLFLIILCHVAQGREKEVHAFYYLWYGNPEVDGAYKHWNHEVLPHWEQRINNLHTNIGQRFVPPEDLHSSFYPTKGPYSSSDSEIMKEHFREMIDSGIDVLVASWWGKASNPASTDTQGINTDITIKLLFEAADAFNKESERKVKIALHLEPFPGRTVESVKEDIEYIYQQYGSFLSFYRDELNGKGLFYIYDSYHIPEYQWKRLFKNEGDISLRNTMFDCTVIGLWLLPQHGKELFESGFDGVYSYFASESFSYGSTTENWKSIRNYCKKTGMLCSLSVGPGYNDSLIRPWNSHNTRGRW
jgi:glycoprotein endo-alpha-1,2-mannosidase